MHNMESSLFLLATWCCTNTQNPFKANSVLPCKNHCRSLQKLQHQLFNSKTSKHVCERLNKFPNNSFIQQINDLFVERNQLSQHYGSLSSVKPVQFQLRIPLNITLWSKPNDLLWFLAHLALMPMSLSNHELSVVCWHPAPSLSSSSSLASSVDSHPSYRFDHRNFISCTYAPSICTWIIKLMQCVFFKWQPFWQIYLCGSPDNIVKLRAFIFGSVMYLYWGYMHRRNYLDLGNILKIINF